MQRYIRASTNIRNSLILPVIVYVEIFLTKLTSVILHPLAQEEVIITNHRKCSYPFQFTCVCRTKIDKKNKFHKLKPSICALQAKNVYLCPKHGVMETTVDNICTRLGDLIKTTLSPLIPGDYILLDLPYYANIGDILIWQGTEDFLTTLPGKCLGKHSKETFDFRPLPIDCTILLQGGGNFGDIWRKHQEFRLKTIRHYPANPIIVLPQTIHYNSHEVLLEDVQEMNLHSRMTICARDTHSAEILRKTGFTGRLLTLPDMAFCIRQDTIRTNMTEPTKEKLLLLREDKELKKSSNLTISDWPHLHESSDEAWKYLTKHTGSEADTFFLDDFFPREIKEGITFASSFKEAYSTRLHFAILRLLLGLPIKMADNSYGKNLDFYNTWLKDSELASLPDEEELAAIELAASVYRQKQADFGKCKQEYEALIAAQRDKQREFDILHAETERRQEEKIAALRAETEWEKQKHRKYKRLFSVTLIAMLLSIVALVTIILNI